MSGKIISDMLTKEEVEAVFKGDIIGREIIFYELTSSTNDRAMEMAQRKENAEGTVIVADAQEQGRGRFGRKWVSPPHVNLYFTVLLKPPFAPKEASVLTLMASVAAASAVREHISLNVSIKWPNDIVIRDKKVGGILTEMKSGRGDIDFVALGIGANINMSLSILPDNVRPFVTSLKAEKGETINRVELLGNMLAKLEHWYKALLEGRKKALLDEWLRLNSTIGNKVRVKSQDKIISGIAEGINDDGELLVRLFSGTVETLCSGEVTILKNK